MPIEPTDGTVERLSLADLLPCLAAIGRAMEGDFDPRRFLDDLSAQLLPLIPHDRLGLLYLDDDGHTFSVFAEHATPGLLPGTDRYTTDFDRELRFITTDTPVSGVFAGETLRVDDCAADPRFGAARRSDGSSATTDLRSILAVPLCSGDRRIGALLAGALAPALYQEGDLAGLRQMGRLIGPFIEQIALFHRERRRRRRLQALERITRTLGASLDVRDIFSRLADAVRPVLNFDSMGVALFTASGRDIERFADVNDLPAPVDFPIRLALGDSAFGPRLQAGETVLIRDAPAELEPSYAADRILIESGVRSAIVVPLLFGEQAGGVIHFGKGHPYWFDRADVEVATAVAAQVVLALQHQRLAEEQRRLAAVEGRARRLEARLASIGNELGARYAFDHIVGRSPALKQVLARAAKVASTEATVLLTGESGTGKELVARAIHHASPRVEGPFVALNCAALPETLLESELFGHERGAFTGADRQKPGRFELAAGGTLFLDEVGELAPSVQAKLLRVLQEREFQRLGGTVNLRADVRLIAATNRDLNREMEAGRFRTDLYYRLNVFSVHLPPLCERGDDVLLLAGHFVRTLGVQMGKGDLTLSRDAREALLGHTWPGNIRELQNAVEHALILSEGALLTAAQLGIRAQRAASSRSGAAQTPRTSALMDLSPDRERQVVMETLERVGGNKSSAAALLGISRFQLYNRLKRYSLDSTP